MPGVFTHLLSERREVVYISEHSQSTFPSNYMMCKTTTRESTLEWTPLQNRSLLNCMRASSIPSHMQDRKSKIKFFITEKLAAQEES